MGRMMKHLGILAALAILAAGFVHATPADADQVLETKQHATAAACQLHAATAAGELGKRFKVIPIMQTGSAVIYKVAYGPTTAFVSCDGPNFKTWIMN